MQPHPQIKVGDPARFAIQSQMTEVYTNLSLRGLGYFALHVQGKTYGVMDPDATSLARAHEEVRDRLALRGRYASVLSQLVDGLELGRQYHNLHFGPWPEDGDLPSPANQGEYAAETVKLALETDHHIHWSAGDEEFDDGSMILHFDVDSAQVRLIAFRTDDYGKVMRSSFSDLRIEADEFYRILQDWSDSFLEEWETRISRGEGVDGAIES